MHDGHPWCNADGPESRGPYNCLAGKAQTHQSRVLRDDSPYYQYVVHRVPSGHVQVHCNFLVLEIFVPSAAAATMPASTVPCCDSCSRSLPNVECFKPLSAVRGGSLQRRRKFLFLRVVQLVASQRRMGQATVRFAAHVTSAERAPHARRVDLVTSRNSVPQTEARLAWTAVWAASQIVLE